MAHVFPTDFDIEQMVEAEQRVLKIFLSELDDDWYVIPNVLVTVGGEDFEIDCLLVSHSDGMFAVEVKGGVITVEEGQWRSYRTVIKDPAEQVMKAKHALLKRLKKHKVSSTDSFLQHLVVFPDIEDFPSEGAGPNCPRSIVLTGADLRFVDVALKNISREKNPLSPEKMSEVLKALRPDVTEIHVDGSFVKGTTQRITKTTNQHLRIVIELDGNRHLFVSGPAGTGKTYIATKWAERSVVRGDRTLIVCFNEILGEDLQRRLGNLSSSSELHPLLRVGAFHKVLESVLGSMTPPKPSSFPSKDAERNWWRIAYVDALKKELSYITERYDTIIIDEVQDFHPEWIEALKSLLEDSDFGRIYMLGDEQQKIYNAEWKTPEGFFSIPLEINVRNTRRISRFVEQFGGAQASSTSPAGPKVTVTKANAIKECRKAISKAISEAVGIMDIPPSQIMILTGRTELRDQLKSELIDGYRITGWDDRDDDSIVCETIHKTKGIERTAIIVADLQVRPSSTLLYIGASRAVAYLAVIGSQPLIDLISE
jgi:hypothetical protein